MAGERIIPGDAGILYIFDTVWVPIGCLTSYSLNTTVNEKTRQTKCNPGVVEKGYGALDASIDFEGLYVNTAGINPDPNIASHDILLALQQTKSIVQFRIDTDAAPEGEGEGLQYYGNAIISNLTLTQGTGDEDSTFSGTFGVSGDILTTDPTT